jgi:hypothetical protein
MSDAVTHPLNLRTIPELRDRAMQILLFMEASPLSLANQDYVREMRALWQETFRVRNKAPSPAKKHTPLSPTWGVGQQILALRRAGSDMSCDKLAEHFGMEEDGAAGRISAFCKRWELLGGERPKRR